MDRSKIQFHGENRFFHVMWAEKVVFYKRCAFHHMLKANCSEEQKRMAEEQKKKAIYTENGITYDTRPIYKTMSNVHPETIQSAPQVEGALSSTDVATTHKGMPIDSERQISQPELAQDVRLETLVQSDCYEIPNLDTPITGETGKNFLGRDRLYWQSQARQDDPCCLY